MEHLEAAFAQCSPILDPFSFGAIFTCLENCIYGGAEFPDISQRAVNILDKAIKADAIPHWRSTLFKKVITMRKNLESEITYLQLRLKPTAHDSFKTDQSDRRDPTASSGVCAHSVTTSQLWTLQAARYQTHNL